MIGDRQQPPVCKQQRPDEPSVKVQDRQGPKMRQFPQFEAFNNYIQSFIASFHLAQKIRQLRARRQELVDKVLTIEKNISRPDQRVVQPLPQSKRKRRLADEISRSYQCPEPRCMRLYGALGSLQQHMRLKHHGAQIPTQQDLDAQQNNSKLDNLSFK